MQSKPMQHFSLSWILEMLLWLTRTTAGIFRFSCVATRCAATVPVPGRLGRQHICSFIYSFIQIGCVFTEKLSCSLLNNSQSLPLPACRERDLNVDLFARQTEQLRPKKISWENVLVLATYFSQLWINNVIVYFSEKVKPMPKTSTNTWGRSLLTCCHEPRPVSILIFIFPTYKLYDLGKPLDPMGATRSSPINWAHLMRLPCGPARIIGMKNQ